jgi:hypothetical protein
MPAEGQTSRRTMLIVLTSAVALAAIPAVVGLTAPQGFDAAGYVELWRDAGNQVGLAQTRSGKLLFGLHNPNGMRMPPRWSASAA